MTTPVSADVIDLQQGEGTTEESSRGSSMPGFYRLTIQQRRARVAASTGVPAAEVNRLGRGHTISDEQADQMAENVLGVLGLPLGVCVNMQLDGEDRLIPMAIEEPSVVAAASHAAKMLRAGGGVCTEVSPAHMVGQVQLLDVPDMAGAERAITAATAELLELANGADPALVAAGGGALELALRRLPPLDAGDPVGEMLVLHLTVDVRDAMGANAINSMCERLAPRLEQLTGGRVGLRILSNLSDRRTVTARGVVPFERLHGKGPRAPRGEALARAIEEASVFAERDPYRAATHNKGIMNGVDAVLLACGQDWRAVEAGAHAYAARGGRYTALARWRVRDGALHGELTLPMAVGTVGGVCQVHPTVQLTRRIAGIEGAAGLAAMVAAAGLAQNLGAIRALAAEGIQQGHMRLHARNVAVEAGARAHEVDQVARRIAAAGEVNRAAAQRAVAELRAEPQPLQRIATVTPLRRRPLDREETLPQRFQRLSRQHLPQILQQLERVVDESTPGGSILIEMCRYHLGTGGKRLRAVLPLMVAEALGQAPAGLVPFGAACEMLHNATLVHDDLQDGDRTRRGQRTVWDRFGAAQAIDLGDAMFYYALLLTQRLELPPALRERIGRRLLVETIRVIDGQERELALRQQRRLSLEQYFELVIGKTSGLFGLPMVGAAELCGAPAAVLEALQEAATHLGVLFQVQDDVLDLYGDKGRGARGNDILEGKRSILVVHALEHAPAAQAGWLLELLDRDRDATGPEEVARAIRLLRRLGSLDFALDEIRRRGELAADLPALAGHPGLADLVQGLGELFLRPIRSLLRGSVGSDTSSHAAVSAW